METWNGCARSPSSLALPWARCPESPLRPVRGVLWGGRRGLPLNCCFRILPISIPSLPPDVTPATFETPEVHTGTGVVGSKARGRGHSLEDGDGE